ncbi:probable ATP-dependent DNA helicase CHR12 [Chenopodium quinoa]|uniref:probable ATP-dependent DNA helicase CHR12 n=1 Tax=Chenopodium quinoa TaxID=63459 RepID=UPI000B78FE23|nr:probable ATP-dependent DNA helicase CHR12 [Chenopodium quinoa]
MVTQVVEANSSTPPSSSSSSLDHVQKTKTLICALNLLSRDLPLPPEVFASVSSIYRGDDGDVDEAVSPSGDAQLGDSSPKSNKDASCISSYGDLIMEFEDAVVKQRPKCMSSSALTELNESRFQSRVEHRLTELEELPSSRGEDLQSKCLLELYGLKLADLQSKVRSEVSSEYWLRLKCVHPEKQLFDWGMTRLPRPYYGVGHPFARDADDQLRKKRDAERLSRFEEEEKNFVETRKRKFFADLLNAAREFQLQVGSISKRRKQRNDGVMAWHGRQRQRATRQEKMRMDALKKDDQEAYMKMVEESKNERLTMLLGKTNDLLVSLGAAVQRQKDAEHFDGIEPLDESDVDIQELDVLKDGTPIPDEDIDASEEDVGKAGSLLDGQKKYNSAVHSIQEKVTEQPSMLQGGELRPYQLEGLQWMLSLFNNNLNGILADEMGLGKTIQTIALIAYLLEVKGVGGPHLIVAPKAVLPNWVHEFQTWVPGIVAVLYDGRQETRKAIREEYFAEEKFCVMITHYDLIMRDKLYLKKIHWYYMIIDEGHRLKNHECALARILVSEYRIRRRLLLTGTPIQNSLQELWALLNFLLPHIFNSVENFAEWFNAPFSDRSEVALTDEEQLLVIRRLHHVIRPFILRRKKDEVEKYLPGKTQVILKCDLSAWQKIYYQQVTDMGRVGMDSERGKSKGLQNLSMQLRKCCNHPYLFLPEYNIWRSDEIVRASGKFELLDRLLPKLAKSGHRVLLFSQMTRLLDILEVYLRMREHRFLRLDGSSKTDERGTLLKEFNAPDSPYFIFLLSTRAGGLGLNLQTADTVIIFDSDWNPQMDQQAEDRAHRIGQKKEVRVFVLVSVGSIEEVILERAKQKMGIDAKVIQAGLFNTTSTAQDRKEMLEVIMRRGTSALGTDIPSEREINRLAARTDEEFWLFEKMDEERRQKENYRPRLMEDHEVPEWVYTVNTDASERSKGFDHEVGKITGKRKRKEVIYADTISDLRWVKAVENGEDLSSAINKKKRKEAASSENFNSPNNNRGELEKVYDLGDDDITSFSDGKSEEFPHPSPQKMRMNGLNFGTPKHEDDGGYGNGSGSDAWNLTWKTHKKKRSSINVLGSSTSISESSRGQNSSGRGNRWS